MAQDGEALAMAYRVLVSQFMHETNTFSKLPTTLEDYRRRWLIEGEAIVPRFTGTRNELGGYIDAVAKFGWAPVWGAAANATPSGKPTKACWETIRDIIVGAAKRAGPRTMPRARCSRPCARWWDPTCRSSPRSICTPT